MYGNPYYNALLQEEAGKRGASLRLNREQDILDMVMSKQIGRSMQDDSYYGSLLRYQQRGGNISLGGDGGSITSTLPAAMDPVSGVMMQQPGLTQLTHATAPTVQPPAFLRQRSQDPWDELPDTVRMPPLPQRSSPRAASTRQPLALPPAREPQASVASVPIEDPWGPGVAGPARSPGPQVPHGPAEWPLSPELLNPIEMPPAPKASSAPASVPAPGERLPYDPWTGTVPPEPPPPRQAPPASDAATRIDNERAARRSATRAKDMGDVLEGLYGRGQIDLADEISRATRRTVAGLNKVGNKQAARAALNAGRLGSGIARVAPWAAAGVTALAAGAEGAEQAGAGGAINSAGMTAAGTGLGALVGGTVGSVVPVVGTGIGATLGGWIGGMGGQAAASGLNNFAVSQVDQNTPFGAMIDQVIDTPRERQEREIMKMLGDPIIRAQLIQQG